MNLEQKIAMRGKQLVNTASQAVIPPAYQLTLLDIDYLIDLIQEEGNPFNALCLAFDYGFVKGNRATKRGKVKAL